MNSNGPFDTPAVEARTYAQFKFIQTLAVERDLSGMNVKYKQRMIEVLTETGAPLTKAGASVLIEGLLTLPKLEGRTAPETGVPSAEVVPEGHYALRDPEADTISFFKVDRPTEGTWAGRVFVKRIVGPEEVRISRALQTEILDRIAVDARAASVLYGHEIGRCGICNRRLTNENSRAAGIGPICASKF